MKTQIAVLLVAAAIAAPAWTAEKNPSSKEEGIGVGSGAALGAVAGGPIGLIIGAALGGWLGDRFHSERSQRKAAEAKYDEAQNRAESSEALLQRSERDLDSMKATLVAQKQSFRNALADALEVEVFFRTGQSELDDTTAERLAEIADLIRPVEDFMVIVDGHADPRGDAEYNDQLSAARAAAVRDVLIRAGFPADRITTRARGETESSAAEDDLDALALDRRVDLTVIGGGAGNRVAQQ